MVEFNCRSGDPVQFPHAPSRDLFGLPGPSDAASGTVADAIAIGACPGSVTVGPDGTCLCVTHYDTRSVSMVNLATGTVKAVGLRDAPLGTVFTPDGTHVYVTNEHSLTVIDTTTTSAYDLVAGDLPEVCSSVPTESMPTAPISATA
ncbi:hypothetical protein MYSE111917_00940 [Mycobacterium senriense]|uniref:Uncharacterized protein n=1 Tax=Mycobacterium senriense TaxID=2775496 RepID=A0ABN6IQ53_9MYCO|nr:hypothetical protein MTY59_45450 [Mycobacterium senriense]